MKKCLMILFVVIMCIHFGSCRHEETYRFLNSTDEISKISLVAISFDENEKVIQTEIQKISDTVAFLDDFRDVNCYTYYGDPTGVTEEGVEDTVIKISYANDEYELINWMGQAVYTQERGFIYYAGYSVFDKDQFNALISDYLTE